MSISLSQAIFIGCWAGICLGLQIFGVYSNRCLVTSLGVGIILGDIPTALAMGAIGELAFLGFGVGIAGAAPPNPLGPGIVGTLLCITMKNQGMTPQVALGLSFPFAILVQFLLTLTYTVMTPMGAVLNKTIEKEQFFKFKFLSHCTVYLNTFWGFLVGFGCSISMPTVKAIIDMIPQWLITGLKVSGGMLPAAGFAIILNILTKGDKRYLPFVVLGYVCIAYLKLPVMGVTFIAILIALHDYFNTQRSKENMSKVLNNGNNGEVIKNEV